MLVANFLHFREQPFDIWGAIAKAQIETDHRLKPHYGHASCSINAGRELAHHYALRWSKGNGFRQSHGPSCTVSVLRLLRIPE